VVGSESRRLRVVVVGLGQMGQSHALAYHRSKDFDIVGLIIRNPVQLDAELTGYPRLELAAALSLKPDLVAVCTHAESHAPIAHRAIAAGAHVFVEKPMALTLTEANALVEAARLAGVKLVSGHILRHHPAWIALIDEAKRLGPPFVMRMNLNQRSSGSAWDIHRKLLRTTSPTVDCGVHYVDVMLEIAQTRPVQVRGMGVRLSQEIAPDSVNYSHLQLLFECGSVGWYEAGWGPMISETAHFVKDVMGGRGSVSLMEGAARDPADLEGHVSASVLRLCPAAGTGQSSIDMAMDEPGHLGLCALEQAHVYRLIVENGDAEPHLKCDLQSLEIVLAADRSMREGCAVDL